MEEGRFLHHRSQEDGLCECKDITSEPCSSGLGASFGAIQGGVGEGTFFSFLYIVPDDDRVPLGRFALAFRFMKFDMRMLISFTLSRSQEIIDEGNAVLHYGDGGENSPTSPKFKTKDQGDGLTDKLSKMSIDQLP